MNPEEEITIDVVVGGQYGSEGKGHVTAQVIQRWLRDRIGMVYNVRVAGPNAGHSVVDGYGNKFALRTIPVGAVKHGVMLVIAAGSEVDLEVLKSEVDELAKFGYSVKDRLYIDPEATVLEPSHRARELSNNLASRIGSTGKGIGAARADRIWRDADRFMDHKPAMRLAESIGAKVVNTAQLMTNTPGVVHIVIEGTQGYGLGLHAGNYPTCTSSDCRAIDFLAMAGVSPWVANFVNVWVCARMYPIRVAGPSGPMLGETNWDELGLEEELTTVTHKVRRVGEWDQWLLADALHANGAHPQGRTPMGSKVRVQVALTMVDQRFPEMEGLDGNFFILEEANPYFAQEWSDWWNQNQPLPVTNLGMLTTSDRTAIWTGPTYLTD